MGGVPRVNLAHVTADGRVVSTWDPHPTGEVLALGLRGPILYIGGDFTSIGGRARHHIAALSARTGRPLAWNPDANGDVGALAISGRLVYVGGAFTATGGSARAYIAAVGARTGRATRWNKGACREDERARARSRTAPRPQSAPLPVETWIARWTRPSATISSTCLGGCGPQTQWPSTTALGSARGRAPHASGTRRRRRGPGRSSPETRSPHATCASRTHHRPQSRAGESAEQARSGARAPLPHASRALAGRAPGPR